MVVPVLPESDKDEMRAHRRRHRTFAFGFSSALESARLKHMAGYNELKTRTLAIFVRSGPIRPAEYMVCAKFYPVAAAHGYLIHLRKMGLLKQTADARGRHLYSITPAGERRLAWLRDRSRQTSTITPKQIAAANAA